MTAARQTSAAEAHVEVAGILFALSGLLEKSVVGDCLTDHFSNPIFFSIAE